MPTWQRHGVPRDPEASVSPWPGASSASSTSGFWSDGRVVCRTKLTSGTYKAQGCGGGGEREILEPDNHEEDEVVRY